MSLEKFINNCFISHLGKHGTNGFGKSLKMDNLNKVQKNFIKNNKLGTEDFSSAAEFLNNNKSVLTNGLKIGTRLTAATIEAGVTGLINSLTTEHPLVVSNHVSPMKLDSLYIKTHVHVGIPTSSRLKGMRSVPNVEYEEKILNSSLLDYQDHNQRKNLTLKTGFNEKGFCFLMEDFFISVDKLVKFYFKDQTVNDSLGHNKNGIINLYGCAYKTTNKVKIINRIKGYSVGIRIHLVKINDLDLDVRQLVKKVTNNKFNKKENAPERGYLYGKIPEDEQYSDPKLDDMENKITLDFKTNLSTKLTDSVNFNDRAKIVRTFSRVLNPGSIWEFNLDNHLGKGIHLNYLADIEGRNKNHPIGYIYVLEYIGDRRGKLIRDKDSDHFIGYSPTKLHFEFEQKITYLSDYKNGIDSPTFYRTKKRESDFEEDSLYEQIFCPTRGESFHVEYENVRLSDDPASKETEFTLEYDDTSFSYDSNIIKEIQNAFEKNGIEPDHLSEDDRNLNLRGVKPDNEDESL